MSEAEHEYVDLMLDIKDGKVVSCEFYGEGRQVEPLTEPMLFKPLGGESWPRHLELVGRRLIQNLKRRLSRDQP